MTDNITTFPQEPKQLFVCFCGCASFYIMEDGSAKCCVCDEKLVDGLEPKARGWFDAAKMITTKYDDDDDDGPIADINGNGSVEFARRRIAQIVDQKDAVAIIVIIEDGGLNTWTSVDTADRKDWLFRKLTEVHKLFEKQLEHYIGKGCD